jgi:hypothetical protein
MSTLGYIVLLLGFVNWVNSFHSCSSVNTRTTTRTLMRTTNKYSQNLTTYSDTLIPGNRFNCDVRTHQRDEIIDKAATKTRPTYMPLDSGLRISRILTASTDNFDVMLKLGRAKSLADIMQIALIRNRKKCLLMEYQRLPMVSGVICNGWNREYELGSPIHTKPRRPSSALWVVDEESFQPFQVEIGSWLLASINGKDTNHMSTLFSRDSSRLHTDAQSVSVVRPGYTTVKLVHVHGMLQWVLTLIELENCDELGFPIGRR